VTLVVDPSVAVNWFVREDDRDAAMALLRRGGPLLAPDIVIAETLNVLWRKLRRGEVALQQAVNVASVLPQFFDEILPSSRFANSAFELSLQMDHPVYDCLYLACAMANNCVLVTLDDTFRRKAERHGYEAVRDLLGFGALAVAPAA
jgi:predicted nucleic acid-binding protein